MNRRGFIGTLMAGVGAVLAWPVKKTRPWWLKADGDDTPLNQGTLGPDVVTPPRVVELVDAGDSLPINLNSSTVVITRFDPRTRKVIGEVTRPLNDPLDDPASGIVAVGEYREGEGIEVAVIFHGAERITSAVYSGPDFTLEPMDRRV